MADSVKKIIEIVFAGDDEVSGVIKGISTNISAFGDGLENVVSPLAGITDNILKLDAALAALAIGGLAFAFKKSADFEGSMIELQKVLGEHPEALEKAKNAAFDLSAQYGASSSDILLSTANFKQAGFDIEDALTLTKVSMDLVIAGGLEASQSSELLISTLKGFKAPASEAARLIDVLNEVSNNYATNVQELAIGMAALSPVANLMGFSFEQSAGLLTPIIEIFRSGSEAANALKVGLLQLVNDTAPVEDALKALGISQKNANGSLRSGKDILADVSKAFLTVNKDQKLYFAAQLVGIRQAARMVEVFNGLAKSTEITAVANNAAGSAIKEVEIRLLSAEVSVNKFAAGFENLAIIAGDQFRLAAQGVIDGATDIELIIQNLITDKTFDPLFKALREASTELGNFLSQVAAALPEAFKLVDFEPLLDSLGDLEDTFKAFFQDIDLTTPEGLANAIQFVVDSISSLIRTTEGLVGPLGIFIEKVLQAVDAFNELDEGTKKTIGSVLGWSKVIDTVLGPLGSFLKAVESLALGLNILVGVQVVSVLTSWGVTFSAIAATATVAGANIVASFKLVGAIFLGTAVGLELLAAAAGIAIGSLARLIPGVDEATQSVLGFLDFLFGISDKTQFEIDLDIAEAQKKAAILRKRIAEIQAKKVIKIDLALDEAFLDLDNFQQVIALTKSQISGIGKALDEAFGEVHIGILEGDDFDFEAVLAKGEKVAGSFREQLDQFTKDPIVMDIEVKTKIKADPNSKAELQKIRVEADTVQTAFEFSAKVEMADIEAGAKVMASAFDAVGESVNAIADSTSSMFVSFATFKGTIGEKLFLSNILQDQADSQNELIASQIGLNLAQEDFLRVKTEVLEAGGGLIKISADGLEPEIEAFMFKILDKIQIAVTESQSELLLGIS